MEKTKKMKGWKIYVMFVISNISILFLIPIIEYNVIFIFIIYWLFLSILRIYSNIRKIQKMKSKLGQRHLNILFCYSNGYQNEKIFSFDIVHRMDLNFPNLKSYLIWLTNPIENKAMLELLLEKPDEEIRIKSFEKFILLTKKKFEDEFTFSEKQIYFEDIKMTINALVSEKRHKFILLKWTKIDVPIILKIENNDKSNHIYDELKKMIPEKIKQHIDKELIEIEKDKFRRKIVSEQINQYLIKN